MIAGPRLPTLTARRVKLRWLVPADVQSLYDVFSNDDLFYGLLRREWAARRATLSGERADVTPCAAPDAR
jgi:hypothetical protein